MNEPLIDAYIAAWNEPDAHTRGRLLAGVMHEQCTYVDPNVELMNRAALDTYIGTVLKTYPGRRIVRTSEVQAHHLHSRFHWRLVKADGSQGVESVDFVELTEEGRIARITGFFGPLTPIDPV